MNDASEPKVAAGAGAGPGLMRSLYRTFALDQMPLFESNCLSVSSADLHAMAITLQKMATAIRAIIDRRKDGEKSVDV